MSGEVPKQVMHFDGRAGIGSAEADENQRRWTQEDYKRENKKPRVFYDWSRRHLNFEITADRQVKPCGTSESVAMRFQRRMDELGQKPLDMRKDKKKLPNRLIRFVFSGGTERMREMAFGKQQVSFDWDGNAHNENVVRQKEIERWALDIFDWVSDKYGRKNIVGFDVHLDENSPHIHCSVVPVTMRQNRTTNKMEEVVSWKAHFGQGFVDGKKIRADLHTDLYEVVNRRYGMVRGDRESGARHINKAEYFRLLEKRMETARDELQSLERQLAETRQQLKEVDRKILRSSGQIDALEAEKKNLEDRCAALRCSVERKRDSIRRNEQKIIDMEKSIAMREKRLEELTKQSEEINDDTRHGLYSVFGSLLADVMIRELRPVFASHPEVETMLQGTVYEDLDSAMKANIIKDAIGAFMHGVDMATTPQQSYGGGGGGSDSPWRDRDEELSSFAYRCMRWALKKNAPRKRPGWHR